MGWQSYVERNCQPILFPDAFSYSKAGVPTAIKLLQYDGQGFILAQNVSPRDALSGGLAAVGQHACSGSEAMKKPAKDPIREERIHDQAIVDAYGPEEQAMGWYYYLEDKIRFPFQAKCIASKVISPLRKGEIVEARRLAPEDTCASDMLVLIRWQRRNMAVPPFSVGRH